MFRKFIIMLLKRYLNKNGYYVIHKLQYHTDRCNEYNLSRGVSKYWIMPNAREMYSKIVNDGKHFSNEEIESAIINDEQYYP